MNRNAVLSLLVASCCIVAVGVSATTLQSSLSTEPEDVIDVDYDGIPIGEEDVQSVSREVVFGGDEDSDELPEAARSEPSEALGVGVGGLSFSSPDRSLLDLLFDLLASMFRFLLVVGVVTAGYHYRDRLWELLAGRQHTPERRSDESTWATIEPENTVEIAWLAVVSNLDDLPGETQTTDEIAARAIDAGMDETAVSGITTLFEEVRYGGAIATPERERRALDYLDRLDDRYRTAAPSRSKPDGALPSVSEEVVR